MISVGRGESMKILTAKQHGAWAMLFIPFLLSMIIGNARWEHSLLLLAWLFIYLASYPFLMSLRGGKNKSDYLRWLTIYSVPAILFLVYPVIVEPKLFYFGLAFIPGFIVNMYFAKTKNERALTNDFIAIINFCIGGLASYYFGVSQLDEVAWTLFLYCFIFFIGTTFYVKTMIREKKNIRFKYWSWGYHIAVVLIFTLLGKFIIALAFLSSLIRAIVLYGKQIPVMKIGIIEIVNALYFFIAILLASVFTQL